MPTFSELHEKLSSLRFKRTILVSLVQHLDDQFLPGADGNPKLALLTEEKVKVPETAFDEVAEFLNDAVKKLGVEEQTLLSTTLTVAKTPPAKTTPAKKSEAQS